MEFPKLGQQGSGVFDSIKNKLGFGGAQGADEYDEYDEYSEYGDDYDNSYDEYDRYDSYNDAVSTRPATGFRENVTTRPSSNYSTRSNSADLVSYSDVKTHTRYSDMSNRSTDVAPSVPPMNKITGADFVSPYEALNNKDYHSDGLNSLFTPSETSSDTNTFSASPVYAPYETFTNDNSSFGLSRKVDVMRPMRYADVEEISISLKAGNAVVIALRGTRDDIASRILDFSFGAASMCDARVDKLADDVYVVATGNSLLPDEIARLRNQGIL